MNQPDPPFPRPHAADSRWQVPFDGDFGSERLVSTAGRRARGQRKRLKSICERLLPRQQLLYAAKSYSVLCVFQAMDAAGKDGTIRAVFEGLDPNAIRQAAFKAPSRVERQHDFLWRTTLELPRLGEIGLFNRSHYEEVLTVRVHPEFLEGQYPAGVPDLDELWEARYRAIREHERHLAASNTVILKFWLHVSAREQARRFLDRIEEPDKRWKFSARDVYEAGYRAEYDTAVLDMIRETSRPWAPWYVIPADDKPFMRAEVGEIVLRTLESLPLEHPQPEVEDEQEMARIAETLKKQLGD
ncbi:MAG: polyphosphate kinase 2 family protein [Xanthomonadales bacterium]|nr:polyphosphate kinase 2 family protein [Xanthomonadales bacterium]